MLSIKILNYKPYESIEIKLGEEAFIIDLFYYCLDNTFLEEANTISKGILNFLCMLESWKLKIEALHTKKFDFLPFSYYDQYIGFFKISLKDNENLFIQYAVTTEYFGWGTNPSQVHLIDITDKSYQLIDEAHLLSKHVLIKQIDESINTILQDLYKYSFR